MRWRLSVKVRGRLVASITDRDEAGMSYNVNSALRLRCTVPTPTSLESHPHVPSLYFVLAVLWVVVAAMLVRVRAANLSKYGLRQL